MTTLAERLIIYSERKEGAIEIFGDKLRNARLRAEMTQVELAARANVHPITISKWERGELTEVKARSVVKLAEALGVTPNDLLVEEDSENEH